MQYADLHHPTGMGTLVAACKVYFPNQNQTWHLSALGAWRQPLNHQGSPSPVISLLSSVSMLRMEGGCGMVSLASVSFLHNLFSSICPGNSAKMKIISCHLAHYFKDKMLMHFFELWKKTCVFFPLSETPFLHSHCVSSVE